MTPEVTLRPVVPDEYSAYERTLQHAFAESPNEEISAFEREVVEFERTLAAFDGSDLVATAGIYSFDMTVPGGTVPTAGVTWVSVLPTHRRRGILTRLMRRQLDDVRELGREPVAALWASEAPIYGRFGYGAAASAYRATVPRRANRLWPVAGSDDLRLRDVDGEQALDATERVYDHDRLRRPGMMSHPGVWRGRELFFPEPYRRGATALRTLVAESADGEVRAYARYAIRPGKDFGLATTVVRALHALDGAAMSAVLGLLLDHDLTGETSLWLRPPDDPLLQLLVDPRPAEVTRGDGLYVRLVDVGAALAARAYAVPVDAVVEVVDDFCPWNAGRWRLSGDAAGATCERTGDAAELTLDVRDLGSLYLGGVTLQALADAGLVREHRPRAVAALSVALHSQVAPWSSFIF